MDKQQLRKWAKQKRQNMPESYKQAIEINLCRHVTESTMWKQTKSIGITISRELEWNTKQIIEKAWEAGKQVCVPKCSPEEKKLDFYAFHSYDELEIVYYKLQEPKPDASKRVDKSSMDLVIVPGLVFDKQGYRIGFGGGYYDRFLTDFPNTTLSIASSEQVVEEIPVESFDIPVHHLITENGMIT